MRAPASSPAGDSTHRQHKSIHDLRSGGTSGRTGPRAARRHDPRGEDRPAVPGQWHGRTRDRRAARGHRGRTGRGRVERGGCDDRERAPARGGRGKPARHPAAHGPRRDPRLQDRIPDPAGPGSHLEPRPGGEVRSHRRRRGFVLRGELDGRPDDRYRTRPALGTSRRDPGRGPAPGQRSRGRHDSRLSGRGSLPTRKPRRLCQALRRLRGQRERTRLQHDQHPGDRAARRPPPTVQGRGGSGCRHADDLVQRSERRSGDGQRVSPRTDPPRGVAIRRIRGERLGVGSAALRARADLRRSGGCV